MQRLRFVYWPRDSIVFLMRPECFGVLAIHSSLGAPGSGFTEPESSRVRSDRYGPTGISSRGGAA
jgi:hypothetical protein